MGETTKFTSCMCHEPRLFVQKKNTHTHTHTHSLAPGLYLRHCQAKSALGPTVPVQYQYQAGVKVLKI
jgi:hypothetical protein